MSKSTNLFGDTFFSNIGFPSVSAIPLFSTTKGLVAFIITPLPISFGDATRLWKSTIAMGLGMFYFLWISIISNVFIDFASGHIRPISNHAPVSVPKPSYKVWGAESLFANAASGTHHQIAPHAESHMAMRRDISCLTMEILNVSQIWPCYTVQFLTINETFFAALLHRRFAGVNFHRPRV